IDMNGRRQKPQSILALTCHRYAACEQCTKPRSIDGILKRCKGCAVTTYCNKRCQTAAWPRHKLMCTSRSGTRVPPIYKNLGRTTMAELSHAIKEWVEIHQLSLHIIATVLVELHGGGAVAVLAARWPHSVVFNLGAPEDHDDGSPATAFTLVDTRVQTDGQVPPGGVAAAEWTRPARSSATLLWRFRVANAHPDIVGLLPVTFYVREAQLAIQFYFPLHRRRPRVLAGRARPLAEGTKRALQGLVGICTGIINNGTVLRIPVDADQVVPDTGLLERRPGGKGWKWRLLTSESSSQVGNAAKELFSSREFEDAQVPPHDSFTAYHRLWPYHSLRI
ncbi:hypothetical protein V8D89_005347, partial [Ganoderma adspersum]